jgi:regulator of sigma E protease
MLGGIIVNVITGIIIFIFLLFISGETYLNKVEGNKYGVVPTELGKKLGIQEGDKIIEINGKDYSNFADIWGPDVLLNSHSYLTVERNGETKNIPIPSTFINEFSDKKTGGPFVDPIFEFKVGKISNKGGAKKAGLQKGDKIIEANNQSVHYLHEFQSILQANKNKTISLKINREGKIITTQGEISEKGFLGFEVEKEVQLSTINYSFLEAIPKGTKMAFNIVWVNAKGLGRLVTGKVSPGKALSGPIGIAQVFGGEWDWHNFWRITGLLSMVLAFMNFLPIPALDGGHVLFLAYEMISGRKPSDKFLEISTKIGMIILIALMVFAVFNDIFKTIW